MNFFQAIILGIVQGLTEFLPVSSSGHLVIVAFLFRWVFPSDQIFVFNVLVQWGTLLAVIVYFRKDVWEILRAFFKGIFSKKPFQDFSARLGWFLILATIPSGIVGLFLKSKVEDAFKSVMYTSIFLILTGLVLLVSERIGKRNRDLKSLNWLDALWMGIWQAFSIFPGISRSGATMAGGLTRNLDRHSAARFSFLMSIPIMLAAGFLSFGDLVHVQNMSAFWPYLLVGFIIAAIVGFITIHFFLKLISKISFLGFAIYCLSAGAIVLTLSFLLAPLPTLPATTYSPQVIHVESTATLEWLGEKMNNCAQSIGDVAIEYSQAQATNLDPSDAVILRWGEPANLTAFSVQIGSDQLAFIVNSSNSIQSISLNQAQAIYRGSLTTWPFTGEPINVWAYPQGEDIGQIFGQIILPYDQFSSLVNLAPDPSSMRSAISLDPQAIGVIPWSWVDNSIKYLPISDVSSDTLTKPILAITSAEPQGSLYAWLSCLQTHP
jgi:undecaprenyl-diphosphatase